MGMDNRVGRFTSSQISRLLGGNEKPTKDFYTYCKEVAMERILGREISSFSNTNPMRWGKLMEVVLYKELGFDSDYEIVHEETIVHKRFDYWGGTPDLRHPKKVGETKCYYLSKIVPYILTLMSQDIELVKEKYKSEYWQVVSNACLLGVKKAELIAYIPTKSKLESVIREIHENDLHAEAGLDINDVYFLIYSDIDKLQYIPDDSEVIKSITRFEFEVPMEDKRFLIKRLEMAEKEVNRIIKSYDM